MKLSENHRDLIVFVGIGLMLGGAWNYIYVAPHDEFRELVGNCMIDKDDYSVEAYEDCVDEVAVRR